MRGPICFYLRLFFHREDETASASGVGQDLPSFVSLTARIARMELAVAQVVGVPVPQIMKDLVAKSVETLQTQYVDRVATMATDINKEVEVSVVLQPQVSQTASKTAEARRSQFFDRINQMTKLLVEIPPLLHFLPMLLQRQVPQLMWKTAEVPRSQFLDRFAPAISQVTKHVEFSLIKYMHRTSPFTRFRRKSTRWSSSLRPSAVSEPPNTSSRCQYL